ncbi:hypothetical protein QJ48_02745 [Paenibacillus sp. A3]|uniref:hypothetical protein n=1 Tax=Paenibacillus sp. A3 TaxID=1337054 RepID=UPI0006D5396D|nr:hypothetical protein [Paenibacillus sp. A3]KPV60923.1 hypothetical protein QJ48_02745 [Paenibacillus sp. A3]
MKQTYAKRVIVSSLALALLLGGGVLYGTGQSAHAEDAASQQPSATKTKAGPFQEWFGKRSGQDGFKDPGASAKSMPIFEEAAAILGTDKASLIASLKDKTLVQLAAEKNMSEADFVAKLQAARSKTIDEAAASGKLTAEQAEKLKSRMAEHLKRMVNRTFDGKGGRSGMHAGKKHLGIAPDKLASILGLTEDQLKTELKSGKSLTDIAQSKGMSKEQLVGKIKDEMTPWIEHMVDRKPSQDRKKSETNNVS